MEIPSELKAIAASFDKCDTHAVITDRSGTMVYANDAAAKHTGYSIQEMIGKKPGDLWGGLMSDQFYEEMWETISKLKESFVGDMQNRKKNGELYWQEVHIIPIVGSDNMPKYYIGIELMFEEQKKCEDFIRNCKDAKECYNALSVCWPFEWLFEIDHLDETQLKNLERKYAQNEKIDDLADQLFAISNVTFSSLEDSQSFPLLEVLQDVVSDMHKEHPKRKIMLSPTSKQVTVNQNKKLLKWALESLVRNAAQYSKPGIGEVVVLLQRTGNRCIVKVDDNGIGITASEQPRIYRKFYRGLRAKKMNPKGAGLGLYLVKVIADAMHWDVNFVSYVDKGTSFEIQFPVHQTPSA
jgi:PAS domain S-box-containing protein